ncbi:MAG: PAS domain S-box protein [Bacteroidales bacterium]|nr:PAS domain S-box protein [Bacteroidales bacterium]
MMTMKATLNNDNSISIYNDYVHYDSRQGVSPNVETLSELFLKFFSTSDSMRAIANLLDIEIVAVMQQPYGKHSTFFMDHHTHRFDILMVSSALNKIDNAKPLSSLNNLSDGSLILEIPIYINDCCAGYIIGGPFYMSAESAGGAAGSVPVIQPDKVKLITHNISETGCKILADCSKYLRKPSNFHNVQVDADMVLNFGNIYIFDITSDTYVISPYICDIFGCNYNERYTLSDFINSIVEKDRQRVVDFCKQNILLGDKDYIIETTIIRESDGQRVDVEIAGSVITDKNGRSLKTVGYVKDVTELNQTHDKLCQEITSKNRLIKIIGHDLKNPFNGMIGFSELLKLDLEQHNYEEAEEYAEIIKQAASEGYELLVNLLDYSTSQSGDMTIVKKEFDLFKTVDSILKLSSAQAMRKGITLENHVEFPSMIFSDENKINTILRNLISNAIKFCYQDGIIMINADYVGDSIHISVSDTGENISTTRLQYINSGHDVPSTSGTAYEIGTSIGLKLCYTYLEALDSRLVATSGDGVTTFEFTIKANGDRENPAA